MTSRQISPQTGMFDQVISRAKAPRHPRADIVTGARQVFRPMGATMQGTHVGSLTKANIVVAGLNPVILDLLAVSEVWQQLAWQITDYSAYYTGHLAQMIVPIDTWATHDSINHDTFYTGTDIIGDVGPHTFYAPWLEFGTVKMAPRPFMGNAFETVKPVYIHAMYEAAMVAGTLRNFDAPYDKVADPVVRSFRTWLYDKEKALGNYAAFGMRPLLSGPRQVMLGAARAMGDVQSLVGGWAGRRVFDRLSGKITGNIIGVGRASLSTSNSYSGFIGGSVGHRIYQTHAGKYARMATGLK